MTGRDRRIAALRQRADHPGTPAAEAAVCRAKLAAMETERPDARGRDRGGFEAEMASLYRLRDRIDERIAARTAGGR